MGQGTDGEPPAEKEGHLQQKDSEDCYGPGKGKARFEGGVR